MLYTLQTEQFIKSDINTVWDFMSSPANLAKITPAYMGFDIITDLGQGGRMYPGQVIEYYIKPVAGVKMHWVTEITHVQHGEYFVDEQRFGPYKFWHHKHFLKAVLGGVLMTDSLHYQLPFGIFGRIAHALFVKKQLKEIFDFRFKKIDEIFNGVI